MCKTQTTPESSRLKRRTLKKMSKNQLIKLIKNERERSENYRVRLIKEIENRIKFIKFHYKITELLSDFKNSIK